MKLLEDRVTNSTMEFSFPKYVWDTEILHVSQEKLDKKLKERCNWASLNRQITSESGNAHSWKELWRCNLSCCISLCICLWSVLLTTFWVAWMFYLHQNGQCMSQSLLCPSGFSSETWILSSYTVKSVPFFSIFSSRKQFPCSALLLCSLFLWAFLWILLKLL